MSREATSLAGEGCCLRNSGRPGPYTAVEWRGGKEQHKVSPPHESEANGRVVHSKGFAKTYSTNVVEGA